MPVAQERHFDALLGTGRGQVTPTHVLLAGGAPAAAELARLLELTQRGELDEPRKALRACADGFYEDVPYPDETVFVFDPHWRKAARLANGNCTGLESLLVAVASAGAASALAAPVAATVEMAGWTGVAAQHADPAAALRRARLQVVVQDALLALPYDRDEPRDRFANPVTLDAEALAALLADWVQPDRDRVLTYLMGAERLQKLRDLHLFEGWISGASWELWQVAFSVMLSDCLAVRQAPTGELVYQTLYDMFDASFEVHY